MIQPLVAAAGQHRPGTRIATVAEGSNRITGKALLCIAHRLQHQSACALNAFPLISSALFKDRTIGAGSANQHGFAMGQVVDVGTDLPSLVQAHKSENVMAMRWSGCPVLGLKNVGCQDFSISHFGYHDKLRYPWINRIE